MWSNRRPANSGRNVRCTFSSGVHVEKFPFPFLGINHSQPPSWKKTMNMKRTPGLTKEKGSGFGHYTVPTATPRPNYTKYPEARVLVGCSFRAPMGNVRVRGRDWPEIFGDIGAKERTAKAEEATAKWWSSSDGLVAAGHDGAIQHRFLAAGLGTWFSRGFQSEPCRSELNHQCLRENMEKHEKIWKHNKPTAYALVRLIWVVNVVAQEFESLLASLKKEAGLMPGEAVSGLVSGEDEPELADLSLLDERLDVGTGAVHWGSKWRNLEF